MGNERGLNTQRPGLPRRTPRPIVSLALGALQQLQQVHAVGHVDLALQDRLRDPLRPDGATRPSPGVSISEAVIEDC